MEFEKCVSLIQNYLQKNPLIILGSGANIKYGLPTMDNLSKEICKFEKEIKDYDFRQLCEKLNAGLDLETAINQVDLSNDIYKRIQLIVWEFINERDLNFLNKNYDNENFVLAKLLKKTLEPSPNNTSVITTNYDRLVEYAADMEKATIVTGFEGSLVKNFSLPSKNIQQMRTICKIKTVNIWKVHGSLDWFQTENSKYICFPLSSKILPKLQPLIIPPGNEKYHLTHNEPYRTIISSADESITNSNCFLCIGYGFNDEHIQQKIITEIQRGKPIVILTKKITPKCKKIIVENNIPKYIILEMHDNDHTKITSNLFCETISGSYWMLENFLEIW